MITLYAKQKKRHRCTEQTFGLCGRRQGWDILKEQHVYYLGWNRSPAQIGCMRQVLGPGALGRSRGIRWRRRWERGSGWGIHVTPWLIHVNVWQNPLKCCEVISLQLIKINEKKIKVGKASVWSKRKDCLMETQGSSDMWWGRLRCPGGHLLESGDVWMRVWALSSRLLCTGQHWWFFSRFCKFLIWKVHMQKHRKSWVAGEGWVQSTHYAHASEVLSPVVWERFRSK